MELGKKLRRANGILSKLRHNAPIEVLLQVYYAIFYTHMSYGAHLWGLSSNENIQRIQSLQNKCLRIMTFSDFRSKIDHIYPKFGLIKVCDVICSSQNLFLNLTLVVYQMI